MRRFEGRDGGALVVNLFGGPGSGKTTMAARIFSELKKRGVEAACPEEHAKLLIWSGRPWLLDHQIIVVGKIYETLLNLRDKVDVIIVDSPILLGSVYGGDRESPAFHTLVRELHARQDRVNLFVRRPADRPYDPANRREAEDAARAIDLKVNALLTEIGEPADCVCSDDDASILAEQIVCLLKGGPSGPRLR